MTTTNHNCPIWGKDSPYPCLCQRQTVLSENQTIAVVNLLFDRLAGYKPSEQMIKNAITDVRRQP